MILNILSTQSSDYYIRTQRVLDSEIPAFLRHVDSRRNMPDASVFCAVRTAGDAVQLADQDVMIRVEPEADKVALRANSDNGTSGIVTEIILDPRDAQTLASQIQGLLDA